MVEDSWNIQDVALLMREVESFAEGRVETELMNPGAQNINEQEKNIGT